MNHSEIFLAVLFLTIFVAVPVVLALIVRRRRTTIVPNLQECQRCGAHNPLGREHCYCCGFGFILPQADGTEADVIQRVKQADDSKMRPRVGTQTTEVMPSEKNL
jgi:hypothetical protein